MSGIDQLEVMCKDIFEKGSDIFSWQWDGRFELMLTTISSEALPSASSIMDKLPLTTWDSSSVKNAPQGVQQAAKNMGGLRPGQKIITSEPNGEILLFQAWWPWGGGDKISIRIGFHMDGLSDDEEEKYNEMLKGWFGF